ncbi:cystinosin homolog isoform X1 [Pararge aegeria]|uniref:cystinosin homolog isoform X1 n=2 Tax=Pararge aegeria TaxID=116150 RepID=UPI0019D29B5A|nr:cystinosin homolog isoform X1 [Pararge aegeria]
MLSTRACIRQINKTARMALQSSLFPGSTGACSSHRISVCFFAMFLLGFSVAQTQKERLYVNITDINLLVDKTLLFQVIQVGEFNTSLTVAAQIQHPDIVQFSPPVIEIPGSADPNTTAIFTYDVSAYGKSPGHSEVTFNVTPSGIVNLQSVFLRVTVMYSYHIYIISYIMGWIYFVAWSISFYLQIYINFKRKSVVGLNFDFLALNIMGFTMYSLFNCGLYFSEVIQGQYFSRHPRSHNPIQLNDVFFSLHACFATLVTITQCFIYEREDQRVSNVGRSILGAFSGVVIVTASLGAANKIEWLDFLYYCSYIKLCITLIKYVPQAYMNFKRKSTVGWSIGNIFLDFTGGFLSILQMTLNAYNYNDWISFFGDATKFGLGAFSLAFDIFFMLQHYVFYRLDKEFMIVDSSDEGSTMTGSADSSEYFLIKTWHADEKKYDLEAKS